jgi:progesterone-induced-blocking factor 1
LKLELEAHRQKEEVLRTEYYKLEGLNRQGTADIRAENAVLKERLMSYELIEKELDTAIMNVANSDHALDGGPDAVGSALIATITQAPTAAKRRIQQSLLLANRLQTKQKETEVLQAEIRNLKEKLETYESEMKL